MIPAKAYAAIAVVILIVLGVWQYTSVVAENGKLTTANATLDQAVKDGEAVNKELLDAAKITAATVIKTEREKTTLQKIALAKTHELEILKHENKEIKAWAINLLPDLITRRLWDFADSNNKDHVLVGTVGTVTADTRTGFTLANENLYQYAIDGVTALRSCNADKAGFLDWHKKRPANDSGPK